MLLWGWWLICCSATSFPTVGTLQVCGHCIAIFRANIQINFISLVQSIQIFTIWWSHATLTKTNHFFCKRRFHSDIFYLRSANLWIRYSTPNISVFISSSQRSNYYASSCLWYYFLTTVFSIHITQIVQHYYFIYSFFSYSCALYRMEISIRNHFWRLTIGRVNCGYFTCFMIDFVARYYEVQFFFIAQNNWFLLWFLFN